MNILLYICFGMSFGVIWGLIFRAFRSRRDVSEEAIEKYRRVWKLESRLLTFVTILVLALGLIWCVYFLILGIADPEQSEYATNMSQLIVSVLTVVSIIFAFYEFVRRK